MILQGRLPPARRKKRPCGFHRAIFLTACLLFTGLVFPAHATDGDGTVWLSVDTQALTLSLMRADGVVKVFENIAIGSNGATRHKQVADEMTPLGKYRSNEIRPSKRFRLFLASPELR